MAKTVEQIRAQIEKLKEREKALLQKEVPGVVARIKEAVAHYGLTPEQIFGSSDESQPASKPAAKRTRGPRKVAVTSPRGKTARARRAAPEAADAAASRAPNPAKGKKVAPKFKDDAGNVWSGRGSQPRWLRAALESGKTLEDFAVS